MYCYNCGNEIQPGQVYCTRCGSQVGQKKQNASDDAVKDSVKKGMHDFTSTINSLAGEGGDVDIDLGVLFSQVFQPHTKEEQEELFIEDILKETESTIKGKRRSFADNQSIAETDAYIYLGISQTLEDVKNENSQTTADKYLPNTLYFVTTSTRADKVAKRMGIDHEVITSPNILISILSIIGKTTETKNNYLNLFENPFLVNVAKENWECMKKLVDFGLTLKGANPFALKKRLDNAINQWLSTRDTNDMEKVIEKAKEIGVSSREQALNLYKDTKLENERLRKENEKQKNTINQLTKERRKDKYLSRLNKKKKKR